MITPSQLARIERLPQHSSVLTAIIHLNPAQADNQGRALRLRIQGLLEARAVPPTLAAWLLGDLPDAQRAGGRSAVYVVGADLRERFDVQLDLPERVHYGRPLPALIEGIAHSRPPVGVLAVDRECARLFVLEQGELRESWQREHVRPASGTGKRLTLPRTMGPGTPGMMGAPAHDLYEDREQARQQRFFREIAAELQRALPAAGIRSLVLVGPPERVAAFRAELPDSAPLSVIGETNVEVGVADASPAQLLARVLPITQVAEERGEQQLLARLREEGVAVMEAVLQAVQQGRVHELIVPESAEEIHLFRSGSPEPYYTSLKSVPRSPLDGSVMERVTLEDVLPELRRRFGLEVRTLHGPRARRLVREFGGLAGLTRY